MGCQTWTATHLSQRLSEVLPLPRDVRLRVYHISTSPTPTKALFTPAPGKQEEKTHCERHFLAVSIPSEAQWLLGFATEVLIFTTATLTTMFVSKADSSGYLYTGDVPDKRDISKTITSTFLQHLLEARPTSLKVVLSLFAKSQNQYLFPGSSEYPGKRLLPDRKLLRWWCGVLDPVLRSASTDATGHVMAAGADIQGWRDVLPLSTLSDPVGQQRWSWSYPASLIAPEISTPSPNLIPRLPDDPKARYLEDLDKELTANGHWRSIHSLDQFWETMAYRRECNAGRAVGFVWLVFPPGARPARELRMGRQESTELRNGAASASVNGDYPQIPNGHTAIVEANDAHLLPEKSGEVKAPDSSSLDFLLVPTTESAAPGPLKASVGELLLEEDAYDELMDTLLSLDFANRKVALESSATWIFEAARFGFGEKRDWGALVVGGGHRHPAEAEVYVAQQSEGTKRKAEPEVNTLSSGLVRKKPKAKP